MKLQHPTGFFFFSRLYNHIFSVPPLDSLPLTPLPLNTRHPFVMRFLAVLPPLLSSPLLLPPSLSAPAGRSRRAQSDAMVVIGCPPLCHQSDHSWECSGHYPQSPLARPTVRGTTPKRVEDRRWGGRGSSALILLLRLNAAPIGQQRYCSTIDYRYSKKENHQLVLGRLPFGSELR